jgi:hypothetical protein
LRVHQQRNGWEDDKKGRRETVEKSLTLSAAPEGVQGTENVAPSSPVPAVMETPQSITAFQKRMMKAKADMALKYKREEEAKQAAQRKEKIKLRKEKLGLKGEQKDRKERL